MRFSRIDDRAAFTLLEVVVGLLLMATVLVGSLLSFSAHRKQRRVAESKIVAVGLADEWLTRWSASPEGIPSAGGGPIAGKPSWFWQTSIVGTAAPAGVPLRVIRFQIFEVTDERRQRPLTTVEVVEPAE